METQHFHVRYLSEELVRRTQKNNAYSLRSFARDLDITSSWLSEVLNGKKGMSEDKAGIMATSLGLSSVERKLFQLSVKAAHARSRKDRLLAQKELSNFEQGKSSLQKMSVDGFQPFSEWYFLPLLEMSELTECEHTPEWFAKKLNLSVTLTTDALKRLIAGKQMIYENGKFHASHTESSTTFDIPSAAIKKFHQQMMSQAERALTEQPVQQREFTNMTLAFEGDRVEDAQRFIRKFQQEFAEQFYPDKAQQKDSVYQLSIQFFRLDQKGN
jgi:hypothetical protein